MADLRKEMPLLARHEGVWEGVYIHVDTDNNVIDRHKSRLQCQFPSATEYYQINTYTWDDGRTEEIHFPSTYRDGKIWWDNERIIGNCWEADPQTIMLRWERKDMPNAYLYEMIQLSADGNDRARTWHWFENDELIKRTCIKEKRVG
ncbi:MULTISPECIES: DUF3598 domain-containing protein [Brevundimonas]|uniref:DUF3598 domain-containing protein n=1 Tax=Brevundimonas TaxID=41275 RepID=UPI000E66F88C|nr:DUF3598 domain-containing protein [Brevundimonas sp. LPMIX5]RIJ68342.1 DUF3598 domain-containing protein [Brevundimonas sp. LPMIX5]